MKLLSAELVEDFLAYKRSALRGENDDFARGMDKAISIVQDALTSGAFSPPPSEAMGKDGLLEAARELLEVAELRGDNDLPHPSNDSKMWTARMQTAWDELRAAVDRSAKPDAGWLPIATAPKGRVLLLLNAAGIVYSGVVRYGRLGEPFQDNYEWRAECCGRFGGATHWQERPADPPPPTGGGE